MSDPGGANRAPRTVLLIDEDPATARLVRLVLQGPQCQVTVSTSPAEGLNIAARQPPTLVLLERRIRGADGLELASKLHRSPKTRETAVAFLASGSSVADHLRAIQQGAMAYLQKPVEGKALGAAAQDIFARIERGERGKVMEGPAAEQLFKMVGQLEEDAATGTLVLTRSGETAQIQFDTGKMRAAHLGAATGDAALTAMARHDDWETEFIEDLPDPAALFDSFDENTDLSSTAPRLPVAVGSIRPAGRDDETLTEGPKTKHASPFAPQAALGTTQQEEDAEDRTIVDPDRALQQYRESLQQGGAALATPAAPPGQPAEVSTILDRPLDLASTGDFYEEDVPTPLQFGVEEEPSIPTAPGRGAVGKATPWSPPAAEKPTRPAPSAPPAAAPRRPTADPQPQTAPSRQPDLARWLREVNRAPVLLVIPNDLARKTLSQAAQDAGLSVLCVESGREGYSSAIRVRPVAVLSDLRVPDMDGRELVAAIRTDFMVRDTPILMISGDELAPRIAEGGAAAVAPVLQGLKTALLPRVQLYDHLLKAPTQEVAGRMEPLGVGTLLRTIGAARATGRLSLRHGHRHNAEVLFARGEMCGVTVHAPEPSVGPLALLHLVGYEWQDYAFDPTEAADSQIPLGNLSQMVETAHQQNNILLARVFKQGVEIDDLTVDRESLDLYLQTLPPDSLEVLIRLVEGEPAATLTSSGKVPPNVLRSIVFELRRRAVIRPESLRPVRLEGLTGENQAPPPAPVAPAAKGRRWLVVLAAGFATVVVAAGGYVIWQLVLR